MAEVTRISRLGFVNAFLVREDDGLTLIDTTITGSAKAILSAADELGAPIVRIALTHAHDDHVGSLDALAGKLPDAEVIISTRDSRLLRRDRSLDPGEPQRKLLPMVTKVKTTPSRTVEAGDRIGSLEVIWSPGHTPGHVAFLDTRDQTLYCGDVYSTYSGIATSSKVTPRSPLPSLATWDKPMNLESARALRALQPARLAPGHGPVIESPGEGMDDAISRVS